MGRTLVQFETENIERSFIGQIFSSNGYTVVFVDICTQLVDQLNVRRSYDVVIKDPHGSQSIVPVNNVKAIDAAGIESSYTCLYPYRYHRHIGRSERFAGIAPLIETKLINRFNLPQAKPVDIILAENIPDGKSIYLIFCGRS